MVVTDILGDGTAIPPTSFDWRWTLLGSRQGTLNKMFPTHSALSGISKNFR
jgi:hypothetical protein